MLGLLKSKEISPIGAGKFPLRDASLAHGLLESSWSIGMIVIVH